MAETFAVATANTQLGRAIREPGGLESFAGVDALLMQEVLIDEDDLIKRLSNDTELDLTYFEHEFGLAIATNHRHSVGKLHHSILQSRGLIGHAMLAASEERDELKFRLRGRGLIGAAIKTPNSNELTIATTHPTVPVKIKSRTKQVGLIAGEIENIDGSLVLAGDMNHWPRPARVDRQMHKEAGLTPVNIDEATFDVGMTRYAWLGKLARIGLNVDGQLDSMLYRGDIEPLRYKLVSIPSDHKAIITTFEFTS